MLRDYRFRIKLSMLAVKNCEVEQKCESVLSFSLFPRGDCEYRANIQIICTVIIM